MKLTKEFLKKHDACEEVYKWYCEHGCGTVEGTIEKLFSENKCKWANWLITKCFKTRKDYVRYAVFASEQVLHFFEEKYPYDKRPRDAIEAAKKYLCGEHINYNAADDADVAYDAATAAYAAADAAYAAYATAAYAAYGAYAAYAAAYSVSAAAIAVAYSSNAIDDKNKIFKKIIRYGMTLL